ncbi:MAG: ABC transporter ATP-binding protein [Phycisphaerae bacterium]|nr:ABC transporter ATP-binding protein [Phycisphaerae bacterium]
MSEAAVSTELMKVRDLHKQYRMGSQTLQVLAGVDLQVEAGQWLCILGASGSGKSTLLHLMGGLDTPDQGTVHFRQQDLFGLSAAQRDRFRNRHVGFVFQFYHLLPELDVLENTLISAMVDRSALAWPGQQSELRQRAGQLLDDLGLSPRLHHKPNELSGGERQRVAIARALINQPDVLLADEPTGNLDQATGRRILDLLSKLHDKGQTIVMVTHDKEVAARADRVLRLETGKLGEKSGGKSPPG